MAWQAPPFDGGSPLLHYRLELRQRPPASENTSVPPDEPDDGGAG